MEDVAALIADMVTGGVDPLLIGRVAKALAERQAVVVKDESAERRRAADRDRQREIRRHRQTSADSAETPPPLSPLPSPGPQPTPLNPPTPDSRSVDAAFNRFWQAYPKRAGSNPRQPARDKFGAAVRGGANPEAIIAAADAYRRECERTGSLGTPHVAQALTWFNQRRWEDYAIPDPPAEPEREYPAAAAMLADPEADIAELVRLRDTDGWEAADLFAQQHHRRTA